MYEIDLYLLCYPLLFWRIINSVTVSGLINSCIGFCHGSVIHNLTIRPGMSYYGGENPRKLVGMILGL